MLQVLMFPAIDHLHHRASRNATFRGMGRIVVALLVILGHLSAQIHVHAVAHEACASHPGAVCHDHESSEMRSLAVHDHDHGAPAPDETPQEEHEHCPILPIVVAGGAVSVDLPNFTIAPLFVPAPANYLVLGNLRVPPRAPLTYAPKTSPPASA